jgi:Ca2+-binding RTX toxin-like protein
LDIGVSDSLVVTTSGGTFVIMTSGAAGGLSVYRLLADGGLALHDSQVFPGNLQNGVSGRIALADGTGGTVILFGGSNTDAWGYTLQPDGRIGSFLRMDWAEATGATLPNQPQFAPAPGYPAQPAGLPGTLVDVVNMSLGANNFLLTLDATLGQVTSYTAAPAGAYVQIASLGTPDGFALSTPTAMDVAQLGGRSYAIVASAAGSSISVIEIDALGGLTPRQQIIDTASTRFASVQDLRVAQQGDHVFVFAVGADHGVTLFRLLPDGHLVFVSTFDDDPGGNLQTPTTVATSLQDNTLHVFIGTQDAANLVHLRSDQGNLGQVATSSANGADRLTGGAGDDVLLAGSSGDTLVGGGGSDILSSGTGQTTLTGGAGDDIFVIRPDSRLVTITDFGRGTDRLDLTALPMLRNAAQLDVTSTATGAIIRYRDVEVVVTAHNGTPLTQSALFPMGLVGPDNLAVILAETDPQPLPPSPGAGQLRQGSNTHDSLVGGEGADTMLGARGNDTLRGFGGDDILDGENGHDLLWGGTGNDTIYGGSGNDLIGGGSGDDLLYGGPDNDTIFGAAGNDTIFGEGGHTRLWGGPGDDLIYGSAEGGRLGGGSGNDTIIGGPGNDTIFGGAVSGNDLIDGGGGNDVIYGGPDDDIIQGGAGDDFLGGGPGADRLRGGPGSDTLRGGADADTFVFLDADDSMLIEDFSFAEGDRLELDSLLWGGGLTASQVLGAYGRATAESIILDFGSGDMVTLAGITDLGRLGDQITII